MRALCCALAVAATLASGCGGYEYGRRKDGDIFKGIGWWSDTAVGDARETASRAGLTAEPEHVQSDCSLIGVKVGLALVGDLLVLSSDGWLKRDALSPDEKVGLLGLWNAFLMAAPNCAAEISVPSPSVVAAQEAMRTRLATQATPPPSMIVPAMRLREPMPATPAPAAEPAPAAPRWADPFE